MNHSFVSHCIDFVAGQQALLKAFFEQYPHLNDFVLLFDFPKTGVLVVEGETWQFQKHGLGYNFTHNNSQMLIDAHYHIESPDLFDAWRLYLYLDSLGITIDLNEVRALIDINIATGLLETTAIANYYRLPTH